METIEQFLAEKTGMKNEKAAGMLIGFAIYRELEEERARVQLSAKALRAAPIVSQFNSAEAFLQAFETWRDTHKLPALAELDKEPA